MQELFEECQKSKLSFKDAAWKGHNKCLKILVKEGASVYNLSEAFITATRQRNFQSAELLLEAGIDVSHKLQSEGTTPLMIVAVMGYHNLMQKLVTAGASVNTADRSGRTALHYSTSNGRTELLINKGANVNIKDYDDCTPLHLMANVDSSLSLIAEGADVNVKCKKGETPLIKAAGLGKVQEIECLLKEAVDVNAFDILGRNALFMQLLKVMLIFYGCFLTQELM